MMKNINYFHNIYMLLALLLTMNITVNAQQALPAQYPAGGKINYVRTWETVKPVTDSTLLNVSTPVSTAKMISGYYDGLGRELQMVVKKGSLVTNSGDLVSSANATDLVSSIVYDAFGRERFKYLPSPASSTGGNSSVTDGLYKLNPFHQQEVFYNSFLSGQSGEINSNKNWAYNQTNFENAPVNRAVEQFAPGVSWVGTQAQTDPANRRSTKTGYLVNTSLDSVRNWTVTDAGIAVFGTYTTSGMYTAGVLQKTIKTDENGNQSIEFMDKDGLIILRKTQHSAMSDNGNGKGHFGWLCTYYIYDHFNQLRAVIQPEGVKALVAGSWTFNATLLSQQCFRYEYDEKRRLINKQVPGAGDFYMIYDAKDRLIMVQDANLRTVNKWMVTLFDSFNRPVQTGLLLNTVSLYGTANRTFVQHRAMADTSSNYPFPLVTPPIATYWEWLTKAGYDNYTGIPAGLSATFLTTWNSNFSATDNNNFPYPQMPVQSTTVTGMPTWTLTKVVGSTNQYLGKVIIYDKKGRGIQVQTQNITGGVDVVTIQYSWSGKPLIITTKLQKAGTLAETTVTVTKFTYDELVRIVKLEKKISNSNIKVNGSLGGMTAYKTIFQQEYDALGNVKKKTIGPEAAADGSTVETQIFDYNIRNWMIGVNRSFVNDAATNKFGFELGYDKASSVVTNTTYATPQFNGNISGITWKTTGDQEKRKYNYSYDKVSRLTAADFMQYTSGNFNLNANVDFSVKGLSYDANGNILTMNQRGWKLGGSATIDSLLYTYFDNSNRLKNILDRKNDTATKLGDFRSSGSYMQALSQNKTIAATDYNYDANGNLVRDLNKNIGTSSANGITYNHLNLPAVVEVKNNSGGVKGSIIYTYDALGVKLKKTVQETGKPDRVTLYLGSTVYENDTLQFISHEEGRIRNIKRYFTNGDSAYNLVFDYFLKDHLSNVRMVLTEQRDTAKYYATMELAYRNKENALFSNISNTASALPAGYPVDGSTTSPNDYVVKLNGSGNKIGPGIVLKVMSGDSLSIAVKSYFKSNANPGSSSSPVNDILISLASGITGSVGDLKGSVSQIGSPVGPLAGMVSLFRNNNTADRPSKPRSYLNWILFDEQLNYVTASSGADPVKNVDVLDMLTGKVKISKNGFLYVYLSNETQNWDVFFNDLVVQYFTGELIEETNYYPFGLAAVGVSAKALQPNYAENKNKFNGGNELQSKEFNDGSGLELYDARYRMYDPQICRFNRIEPLADIFNDLSPFHYSYNNPIRFNDPFGLNPNGFGDEDDNYKNEYDTRRNIIAGWIRGKNNKVFFNPKVHSQSDMKKLGLEGTYLSEEINIVDENGNHVGFGNDQGGITYDVELPQVIVSAKRPDYDTYGKVGVDAFRQISSYTHWLGTVKSEKFVSRLNDGDALRFFSDLKDQKKIQFGGDVAAFIPTNYYLSVAIAGLSLLSEKQLGAVIDKYNKSGDKLGIKIQLSNIIDVSTGNTWNYSISLIKNNEVIGQISQVIMGPGM